MRCRFLSLKCWKISIGWNQSNISRFHWFTSFGVSFSFRISSVVNTSTRTHTYMYVARENIESIQIHFHIWKVELASQWIIIILTFSFLFQSICNWIMSYSSSSSSLLLPRPLFLVLVDYTVIWYECSLFETFSLLQIKWFEHMAW